MRTNLYTYLRSPKNMFNFSLGCFLTHFLAKYPSRSIVDSRNLHPIEYSHVSKSVYVCVYFVDLRVGPYGICFQEKVQMRQW